MKPKPTIKRHIGVVMQNVVAYNELTVEENINYLRSYGDKITAGTGPEAIICRPRSLSILS